MIIAVIISVLVAGAVYLIMQRGMMRIVVGMSLLSHAVNLTILAAGGGSLRGEDFTGSGDPSGMSDPIPQAFVLTAIVISLATTALMLALAAVGRDDDTSAKNDPDAVEGGH